MSATVSKASIPTRQHMLNILGATYTLEKDYDKAAQAFSGLLEPAPSVGPISKSTGAGTL